MIFLRTALDDYKQRKHSQHDGKTLSMSGIDQENEHRACYALSQHFRCNVRKFKADDKFCKIDFVGSRVNDEPLAFFEFKKRGGNHNDSIYKGGLWLPETKLNGLIHYGIHERKKQDLPCIENLFYCWGFNDGLFYINVLKARVWLLEAMKTGTNYRLEHKGQNQHEWMFLVPQSNPHLYRVNHNNIDMPWRYGDDKYPWITL